MIIHYAHFRDGLPLCWDLDQVSLAPEPDPSELTSDEDSATCPECRGYLDAWPDV